VFDKMTARKYFVVTERSLLRWGVDDSNNTRGAFLGLVCLVLRSLKMVLLMSHDKTKTLELGIQDRDENNQIGFILKYGMKITYMGQNINGCSLNRLGHMPI
jgi:hypothetical protein